MDRYHAMQAFVAVVDTGSFVKAADHLALSKAAMSRLVSELEDRLGTRLLQRTTRRLSLTVAGEVFHARCKTLLADLAEAEAEVTAQAGQAVGLLRINAPVTFGILHLAPLWAAFKARHPQVSLDVTLSDRVVDLVDEGFDIAIRIARLAASSLISRKLASTRMVLCASPEYLARHGTPKHPAELSAHQLWAYRYFSDGDNWPFEGPDGPLSVRVAPCLRSNNGDTCRAGALQHQAIVLQPTFLIGADLAAGTLVEVLPQYRSLELGIYAVYPTRQHLPPKVRLLIDFLADAFAQPSWAGGGTR